MIRGEDLKDAIFLDLDGTLIDIAPAPDRIVVPEGLVAILGDLTVSLDGALAILTGRPIRDVDRMLSPLRPVAAGVHGAELRASRDGHIARRAEPIDPAMVEAIRGLFGAHPGVHIEMKGVSVAVHYRMAPQTGPRIEAGLRELLSAGDGRHALCRGRRVFEIVPRQASKGAALEEILDLPLFRGRRPVMVGDDVTDQSAFAAAERLGGRGLRVAGDLFATEEADFSGPAEVRAWLAALSRSLVP